MWVVIYGRSEKKALSEGHLFLNCYHCINKINNIHQNILRASSSIFLSVVTQSVCLTGVLGPLHQQGYRSILLRYQNGNISSQPSYTDKNLNYIQLRHHCRRIKSLKRNYVGNYGLFSGICKLQDFSRAKYFLCSLSLSVTLTLSLSPSLCIYMHWCDSRVTHFYYKTSLNMKTGTLLLWGILRSCGNCAYS